MPRKARLLAATTAPALVAVAFCVAHAEPAPVAPAATPSVSAPASPPSPPLTLRVLTFNAFGIEGVAPAIDERMEAIPAAIFALSPDVVLVQELWRKRDADMFTARFHDAGFVEVRSFGALHLYDPGKGGLFVASRYPFEADGFTTFVDGTYPHIPIHLDWRGGKGFFVARIATPAGPIGVLNAHLQASYETGHYEATRIGQITQMSESLRTGATSGMLRAKDPLIVGGDLNAMPEDPSMRLLELATGVHIGESYVDTDLIAARNGDQAHITSRSATRVLLEPLRLSDGSAVPLSDHEGLLVEYALRDAAVDAGTPAHAIDRAAVLAAVQAELDADARRTTWLQVLTAAGSILSLVLAVRVGRWARTHSRRRTRAMVLALTLWCVFWCVWWAYTSIAFAPHQLAMIRRVTEELASYSTPLSPP